MRDGFCKMERLGFWGIVLAMLIVAGTMPVHGAEALGERVRQILERRGLGADALNVIDNLVSHEGPPPPAAPTLVRELLKHPLSAVDAATLFDRGVPVALRRLVETAVGPPRQPSALAITERLTPHLDKLAAAQGLLRAAAPEGIGAPAILKTLNSRAPSAEDLRGVMRAVDGERLARAHAHFVDAVAGLIAALRAVPQASFPDSVTRFQSPIGLVVIGTTRDDVHGADAALIIDQGGNDRYTRAPTVDGNISIIVDLAGNDQYGGADVVVHGLSAIVDFAGDDRYVMSGAGQGAAIAGVSLLVDFAGDDVYEAGFFAQGAAAFGWGEVIDLAGNDRYQVRTSGQGYGMAGGVGLLWDRAGNDRYTASGLPDTFDRGGSVSFAQGAAYGYRTSLGGGIGILRDDAGDDSYIAEMFAQGVGYYYGLGLLWDRGGNDRYQAVRYAQGNGVHEAVGVLRDESGNDSYSAAVGVSQGMGLDLAVGVLYDGAGDDSYRGESLVQGAATSNGIGILIDTGGTDQWQLGGGQGWGDADGARGMPTMGLMLHDPTRATHTRAGKSFSSSAGSIGLGGPLARVHVPAATPAVAVGACPAIDSGTTVLAELPITEALSRAMPGLAGGKPDAAAYAHALRQLTTRLRDSIAELPRDDFNVLWTLGRVLECAAQAATEAEIDALRRDIEQALRVEPAHAFAGVLLTVLRSRPLAAARMQTLLQPLTRHPACSVRAGVLRLMESSGVGELSEPVESLTQRAQAGLTDACWRLQLAARDVLRRLNVPFDEQRLPLFLRLGPAQ